MTLELRDHAHARPRAPDQRHDPARPATVEPEGQLVEDLVGRCVIRLAHVAEPAGDRGEERRELERIGRDQPDQVERAVELGLEHAVERFERLLADELVLDQAGAVDQADGFAVAAAPAVEHARPGPSGRGRRPGHTRRSPRSAAGSRGSRELRGRGGGTGRPLRSRPGSPGRPSRRSRACSAALISASAFRPGVSADSRLAGQGRGADDQERRPPGPCQLGRDQGGDPASTAGDQTGSPGLQLERRCRVLERALDGPQADPTAPVVAHLGPAVAGEHFGGQPGGDRFDRVVRRRSRPRGSGPRAIRGPAS